jgi:hypothetical protein
VSVCLERFQRLENCDDDGRLYRRAAAYAEDVGIILTGGDEKLNRPPAWFKPPVGAGLERVPPSELYAARTAQLERDRAWAAKDDENERR